MSSHVLERCTSRQLMYLVTLRDHGSEVAKGIIGDLTIEMCKDEEQIAPYIAKLSKREAAELIKKSRKDAREPYVDFIEILTMAFAHIAAIPTDDEPLPKARLAVFTDPYKFRKSFGMFAGGKVKIGDSVGECFNAPNVGGSARQKAFLKFLRDSLRDRDYSAEFVQ